MKDKQKRELIISGVVLVLLVVGWIVFAQAKKDTKNPVVISGTCEEIRASYIGLTEEQASNKADAESRDYRVNSRDDQYYPVTMDYGPERLNFRIENKTIKESTCG